MTPPVMSADKLKSLGLKGCLGICSRGPDEACVTSRSMLRGDGELLCNRLPLYMKLSEASSRLYEGMNGIYNKSMNRQASQQAHEMGCC